MARLIRFSPEAIKQLDDLEIYFFDSMPSYAAATCVNAIVDRCDENLSKHSYRGVKYKNLRPYLRIVELNVRIRFNERLKLKEQLIIAFEDVNNVTNIIGIFYDDQNHKIRSQLPGKLINDPIRPI